MLFLIAALTVQWVDLPEGSPRSAQAASLTRPNVVLIVTDDQSIESVARMPFISGRNDWVKFENAFLNVALCCPSRASILTGQYSHHTGVEDNYSGAKFREGHTIATWLKSGGYRTSYIGKYLNGYPFGRGHYVPTGWDNWRVFERPGYYNYTLNENRTVISYGSTKADYSSDVLSSKATTFINKQTGPFLLMLAPNAPHGPRTPARRHLLSFTDITMPRTPNFNEEDVTDKPKWVQTLPSLTSADAARMDGLRRDQYRTLLSVDDMVRNLFSTLEAKGVLEKTVIIFMTDNGFSFGEHRFERKTCPYEECVRTPLLVRYPGRTSGGTVGQLVQNVDLASTINDLANVTATIPQDGLSLVPLLEGTTTAPWRQELLLHWGGVDTGEFAVVPPYWGIRTKRYKYIELSTGEKELYDLSADPYELVNRANQASFAEIQADLAQRLAALKQS